jgi:hypothetical protein
MLFQVKPTYILLGNAVNNEVNNCKLDHNHSELLYLPLAIKKTNCQNLF